MRSTPQITAQATAQFTAQFTAQSTLDRRKFLLQGLAGITALSWTNGLGFARQDPLQLRAQRAKNGALDPERPCLVLVQLTGGNDGLNTVVPYTEDVYYEARKGLAHSVDQVHVLDDSTALAPNLPGLAELWKQGGLGIVHGVGYPQPNRSHFKSLEIWHTADPRGRAAATGWVGRMVDARHDGDVDPHRMVHVGDRLPYSLYSSVHPALSFQTPQQYRWAGDGTPPVEFAGRPASAETCEQDPEALSNLDFVRGVLVDALGSSEQVRSAVGIYRPAVEYPKGDFAQSLAVVAALIASDVPTEVLSVELDGFDTHASQSARHSAQLAKLDEGLSAFVRDVAIRSPRRKLLCYVFSEFGRRVAKNSSGGTDHGTAGPVLVLGSAAKAGMFGERPSLTELDNRGDLVHTTDFRALYATAIQGLFGADAQAVLGARYAPLPLLRG